MAHNKKVLQEKIKNMKTYLEDPDITAEQKESIRTSLKTAEKLLVELETPEPKQPSAAEIVAQAKHGQKKAKTVPVKTKQVKTTPVKPLSHKQQKTLSKIVADDEKYAAYRGTSESDLRKDAARKAKKPGSRTSKTGHTYREYRSNRTDITSGAPHLAKGGVQAKLVKFNAKGTGKTEAYRSILDPDLYFYLQHDGKYYVIVKEKKGHSVTEAWSDWFTVKKDAMEVAKILAEDKDPMKDFFEASLPVQGKIDVSKVTDKDIKKIAEYESTLDEACLEIQNIIGQTDGGIASIHFNDAADEEWAKGDQATREKMLRGYLAVEEIWARDDDYANGGAIPANQMTAYGYTTTHFTAEAKKEFERAIAELEREPDKESGHYYSSAKGAMHLLAKDVDSLLAPGQKPVEVHKKLQIVGINNYKTGYLIETDFLDVELAKRKLKEGGTIKRNLSRDRKFRSQQPHEQNYRRRMKPFNPHYVKELGGTVNSLFGAQDEEPVVQVGNRVTFNTDHIEDFKNDTRSKDREVRRYREIILNGVNEIGTVTEIGHALATVKFDDGWNLPMPIKYLTVLPDQKKKGGETKRGRSRDRKFKSQEKHEQNYKRRTSPRNPHYKTHKADGGPIGKGKVFIAFPYRKKYVVVDNDLKMLWANEYFNTEQDARDFVKQNKLSLSTEKVMPYKKEYKMKEGGTTFKDKEIAIAGNLEGQPVPKKYRGKYGSKYSRQSAFEAAKLIAGSTKKKESK